MEPLRPSDHHDSVVEPAAPAGIAQPKLGVVGWIRFAWRQLTSMRTALVLLLLLAVAAIPGSLVPQRSADPNGVVQFERDNPDLFPVLDALQVFDTYTSAWFSSIYLLLFVSLIGCIIPRTLHHARALRSRPPKTPARLNRLVGYTERAAEGSTVEAELATAEALLKKSRYRVERYGDSLSAERGYLRETGNLVFHMALVGVLATIGFAGGFGYNGQKILIEGQTFVNVRGDYDSLNPGRFFDETQLDPYSLRLDEFEAEYALDQTTGQVQPLDFTASVTTSEGGEQRERQIKVNEPLALGGTNAYLLGNGFAPVVTVRDAEGVEVFSEPIPFLPQDANLTSIGVVKVPTGLDEQLGMVGFFYPSALALESGALTSVYPEPDQPVLTLNAFVGDLGLDDGVPRNAYALGDRRHGADLRGRHRASTRSSSPSARASTCRTVSARSSSRRCPASSASTSITTPRRRACSSRRSSSSAGSWSASGCRGAASGWSPSSAATPCACSTRAWPAVTTPTSSGPSTTSCARTAATRRTPSSTPPRHADGAPRADARGLTRWRASEIEDFRGRPR